MVHVGIVVAMVISSGGSSQRVRADDFPAVALAKCPALIIVHRAGTIQELLDVAAGGGRGVQEQDSAGFAAGVLPGVRDAAGEERAGAGARSEERRVGKE